jgi:FkbM family methyltransferase
VAVFVAEQAPEALLLRSRTRYDRAVAAGSASSDRTPWTLRLARLRPIPKHVETFSPPGRPDLRFVATPSISLQHVYWLGCEGASAHGAGVRAWAALCARSSDVVEVGANVGFYAVPGALATSGRYRVFEPHPRSAAALRDNLAANELGFVEVIESAVVPDGWKRQVRLTAPPGRDWATPAGAAVGSADEPGLEVSAMPVSEAVTGCDLLKVDVEGLEEPLIRSCLEELAVCRSLVVLEVLPENAALWGLLPEIADTLDAELYAVGQASFRRVELSHGPSGDVPDHGTRDFLLVPRDRLSAVSDLLGSGGATTSTAGGARPSSGQAPVR